jgi:hypothetical protein
LPVAPHFFCLNIIRVVNRHAPFDTHRAGNAIYKKVLFYNGGQENLVHCSTFPIRSVGLNIFREQPLGFKSS